MLPGCQQHERGKEKWVTKPATGNEFALDGAGGGGWIWLADALARQRGAVQGRAPRRGVAGARRGAIPPEDGPCEWRRIWPPDGRFHRGLLPLRLRLRHHGKWRKLG